MCVFLTKLQPPTKVSDRNAISTILQFTSVSEIQRLSQLTHMNLRAWSP